MYENYYRDYLADKHLNYDQIWKFEYLALMSGNHPLASDEEVQFSKLKPYIEIVHGAANAMYLSKVIAYNAKETAAAGRYAEIARFIALPAKTADEGVSSLINHIKTLNKALDIPGGIRDYDGGIIGETEFLDKLPKIAELAVGDACTGSNPRKITPAEMEKLLRACYYDTEVDF
jgi:alcohol dehydrogenase class IV